MYNYYVDLLHVAVQYNINNKFHKRDTQQIYQNKKILIFFKFNFEKLFSKSEIFQYNYCTYYFIIIKENLNLKYTNHLNYVMK